MIAWIYRNQEVFPLFVNTVMFIMSVLKGDLGKALYWAGAVILTVGILLMEG